MLINIILKSNIMAKDLYVQFYCKYVKTCSLDNILLLVTHTELLLLAVRNDPDRYAPVAATAS